eukprot:scaffold3823_cov195-Amphora_coffeaeformis.AAC.24
MPSVDHPARSRATGPSCSENGETSCELRATIYTYTYEYILSYSPRYVILQPGHENYPVQNQSTAGDQYSD